MSYRTFLLRCCTVPALFLSLGLPCTGQADQPQTPLHSAQRSRSTDEDVWEAQQQKEMARKANLQRQQDLKKDSEKLLELSTELKQYVDKTNENIMSVDVIKKAEQIEKLAKSIKDKMKGP